MAGPAAAGSFRRISGAVERPQTARGATAVAPHPTMQTRKIVVLIPTYNEANNLPLLVAELWSLNLPRLQILVIDDASPDGTGQIAEELTQPRPGSLQVLHRPRRDGLGRAYVAGMRWALEHGAEIIIQMDSDFSHAPRHISDMLAEIESADVVVGSRFVPGGRIDERWETRRYLLSWFANAVYARWLLNLQVHDATSGFKCWRATALRAIDFGELSPGGYSFQLEMAFLAERLGLRVVEIPIYFEDRRIGQSRLPLRSRLSAMLRVWQIRWRHRHKEPLPPSQSGFNMGRAQDKTT